MQSCLSTNVLPTIFFRFYAAEVLIGLEYLHCLGITLFQFFVEVYPVEVLKLDQSSIFKMLEKNLT